MVVKQYGLKLLVEGIEELPEEDDLQFEEKIFEEVVVLVNALNEVEAEMKIREHYKDDTYENADGRLVTLRLAKILDVYELVDRIKCLDDFVEAYSRHLIVDCSMTVEGVVQSLGLDK